MFDVTLSADNRQLLENAKYSDLTTNYLSGVSTLILTSGADFANNDYILLGNFGSETSEIIKVSTVTTNTLALATATKFSHSESTKVTILKYDQIRFYHTTDTTFVDTDPVTAYIDLQADSFHTIATDTSNTTGFGWYKFYNSTTTDLSSESTEIPYAGFSSNSVEQIFDSFYSLLNNNELKLVTEDDAFRWLNEGYSITRNELNLVNDEFTVADPYTLTTTAGTAEYSLQDGFSKIISVFSGDYDREIEFIALKDLSTWNSDATNDPRYYIRGSYMGFSPTPTVSYDFTVRYETTGTELTSKYDNVDLPTNNFYFLVDYMIYRASPKLNRSDGSSDYSKFMEGVQRMKVTAHKRDHGLDSWEVDDYANV